MCKIIDIKIKLWYINNRVNSGGDIVKFRNMILVLTIAFSAIFVSMLGTSYAYYVSTDGTKLEVTTGNIDTGAAVIFEESQYININNAIPVSSYNQGEKNSFVIYLNDDILGDKDWSINIGLTDIYIDEILKSEFFMLRIECSYTDSEYNNVISGYSEITGESFTSDFISLWDFREDVDSVDERGIFCSLYTWLKETDEPQNHLMNKKFRGRIKVNTLFKSK